MGHAGAWAAPGEPDALTKYQALERAGAVMVNHPEKFGVGMKALLAGGASRPGTSVSFSHSVGLDQPHLHCTVFLRSRPPEERLSHHATGDSSLDITGSPEAQSLRQTSPRI